MKKLHLIMNFKLLLIILFASNIYPQWQKTNGITGSFFNMVSGTENNLLAISGSGTVFQYSNNEWEQRSSSNYSDEIHKLQDKWIFSSSNSISRSDDDGLTWQEIFHPSSGNNLINTKIINDKIFAITSDTLFVSSDQGNSWNASALGDTITSGSETGIFFTEKAFYVEDSIMIAAGFTTLPSGFNAIAYSSNSGLNWQATIFPNGIQNNFVNDITKNDSLYYVSNSEGFFKSIDGISWSPMNDGLPNFSSSLVVSNLCKYINGLVALIMSPYSGIYLYDGISWNLLYDDTYPSYLSVENNEIIFTADGDVIKYDENNNIVLTENIIASTSRPVVSSNGNVFSFYINKLYRTTDQGVNWDVIKDSAKASIAVNGDTIYNVTSSGVLRSTNSGSDWVTLTSGIPSSYLSKLSSVGLANQKVYAGFNGTRARMHLPPVWEQGGVYVSSDNGNSWSVLNSGLPTEAGIPSPVYSINAEGNIVIIYTISGRFSLINDSWVNIGSGFPANTYVSNQLIHNGDVIFITNNGIFISHDKGVTKQPINDGLTDLTYYLTVLFSYNDELYAFATDNISIVYKYVGNQWNEVEFALPENTTITAMQSVGDIIYAGTYDNGIWKYDPSATSVDEKNLLVEYTLSQNYPNPFNPSTTINFTLPEKSLVQLSVYNTLGQKIATLINNEINSGQHTVVFNGDGLASGIYFYIIKADDKFYKTKKMILLK